MHNAAYKQFKDDLEVAIEDEAVIGLFDGLNFALFGHDYYTCSVIKMIFNALPDYVRAEKFDGMDFSIFQDSRIQRSAIHAAFQTLPQNAQKEKVGFLLPFAQNDLCILNTAIGALPKDLGLPIAIHDKSRNGITLLSPRGAVNARYDTAMQ